LKKSEVGHQMKDTISSYKNIKGKEKTLDNLDIPLLPNAPASCTSHSLLETLTLIIPLVPFGTYNKKLLSKV